MALLCVLKLVAAIGAVPGHPALDRQVPPSRPPGQYVLPARDAVGGRGAALGLVILTTTVNLFLSRHENNDRYKHLTPPAALY